MPSTSWDGMEGSRVDDPDSVFNGMRRKNGWQMSGLPWTYELDPGKMALPEREEIGEIHPATPRTDAPGDAVWRNLSGHVEKPWPAIGTA